MSDRKYGATSFQPADAQFHYARVRAAVRAAVDQRDTAPGLSAILVQVSWLEAEAAQKHRRAEIAKAMRPVPRRVKLGDKDYRTPCVHCGSTPTLHPTRLCGPCCTGEAETLDGNW